MKDQPAPCKNQENNIRKIYTINIYFFFISNENFIKKRKTANPSTFGMYYGGINQ